MAKIQRAILSCYDKTGIVELGQLLRDFDVEIISTTRTQHTLEEGGVEAVSIGDFTGVPEMMDGRVKSLHPKVHAGLLAIRDNKLHVEQMQAYEYKWIDLVVVNLRPLDQLRQQPGVTSEEIVEQVDIGGTAMIRSAAKNFRYVTVVVNPERYATVMHELRAREGEVTFQMRYQLAQEAFAETSEYDHKLSEYLKSTAEPEE
jgi:phosphoribosylaminoimidazolecarboxamide formyltransferase / IMP cyclohydrolase